MRLSGEEGQPFVIAESDRSAFIGDSNARWTDCSFQGPTRPQTWSGVSIERCIASDQKVQPKKIHRHMRYGDAGQTVLHLNNAPACWLLAKRQTDRNVLTYVNSAVEVIR